MPEVLNHTIAAWSTLLLVIMQLAYKHEGKLYKNGKGVRRVKSLQDVLFMGASRSATSDIGCNLSRNGVIFAE